jgi:hypothetical protein
MTTIEFIGSSLPLLTWTALSVQGEKLAHDFHFFPWRFVLARMLAGDGASKT